MMGWIRGTERNASCETIGEEEATLSDFIFHRDRNDAVRVIALEKSIEGGGRVRVCDALFVG